MPTVGIVMDTDADLQFMRQAAEILEQFNVDYEISIMSAHRSPDRVREYATQAVERGLKVIVAGAGGAAHLPGIIAAMTPLPVIGVPIKKENLDGLDSLYSIVQMPAGVPVATVSINGGRNAGILAAQIVSIFDASVRERIVTYKKNLAEEVAEKGALLEKIGYKEYLSRKEVK